MASTIDGWSTSYDIDDDFFLSIDGLVEHGQIHTTVHTGGSAHTRRYVSQFIYEFIVLSLPIKRVHEPGECDEQMLKVLSSHLAADEQEEDDTAADE